MKPDVVSSAANVEASCLAVLEELGFIVRREGSDANEEWVAMRDDLHLLAESPLQLLGLFSMRQHRGADWAPTDAEVEALLQRLKSE